ncbi:FAD-dependent monooxygenase [Granulicoccus phenolivorans]|uniref:FAD-dependent monooxygenase n=1 Tax=Granulicoccus phenolivorans TaxID=266854 RepID=UPI0004083A20|nr:FAD-dependent monooxygenase [Granulicoccus phenolivorans]
MNLSYEDAAPSTESVDVLVVGAGPTGLTAALEARRLGMSVRIIDRQSARVPRSKALVVHARTMEMFDSLGLAAQLRERGAEFRAMNLHGPAGATGRIDLRTLNWGDTDFPFWLTVPQYDTEQVLEQALGEAGAAIEWGTEFRSLEQTPDSVVVRLQVAEDSTEVHARWVVGADGGRSGVRDAIGGHMAREDADATFLLADVFSTSDLAEDEGHFFIHPDGFLVIVPMPEPRLWRVIAHLPRHDPASLVPIDAGFLDALIADRASVRFGAHDVGWTSRFALTHGVSDLTRNGRVFLVGDAAHVHSPVGGQGLNTGVQDAHGLIWRLAVADRLDPTAREAVLDSFAIERHQIAGAMVGNVRRATAWLTGRSSLARRVFGSVAPRLLPRTRLRQLLARPLAGLQVRYRDSPLTVTGGGERPANGPAVGGGTILSRLQFGRWTWIAHTDVADGPWQGLPVVRTATEDWPRVRLIRPDGYVAARGDDPMSLWSDLTTHPTFAALLHATDPEGESRPRWSTERTRFSRS